MRADLHIHSEYSGDCSQSVETIISEATSKGLGAIAIADHNSLKGALKAIERTDDLIVMRGMEITSHGGHILAYNTDRPIPRNLAVAETVDLIHEAGGIAAVAHPYRFWSGLDEDDIRGNEFDALEVISGRSSVSTNHKAARLANDLRSPHIGGSDAHSPGNIGRAATIFPDDCRTAEDMVDAIRMGKTMAVGNGRSNLEAVSSGLKCIKEWFQRGMKSI